MMVRMPTRNDRRNIRRVLERGLSAVVVLLLVGGLVLWLTFQHKPSWYRPPELDAVGLQRARADAVTTADDVSDRIVRRASFDIVLEQRAVNQWLAALPYAWPDAFEALPPGLSDLVVAFEHDRVRIGAMYSRGGWRAVISGAVILSLTDDRQGLTWRIEEVCGGSIPVPRSLLAQWVDPLLARRAGDHGRPRSTDSPRPALQQVTSTSELFEGVTSLNRFVWFNGRRPFRIADLRVEEGRLHLRIEPL